MQNSNKHTNRLIDETSPYLLQHAHNAVDWHSWNDETFEKARREDKPILLSIGYSACHWCHVMEHESFEDEATAKLMNENFVNIKVDMEERPDVDKIYMSFVQLTTGSGGWPLTVFMAPDQVPFFGGTYFPPEPRFNMPSFSQILISVSEAYRERRDEVLRSANEVLGEIRRVGFGEMTPTNLEIEQLDSAFRGFVSTFDAANGGFGGAPKFPAPMSLEFLLKYYKRTGEEKALDIVTTTCKKMAQGGIYDQLGGGFHRYSVDAIWLTPHFEKMLYDNAQLARVFLHLYQITNDEFFKKIAIETLDYVEREMLDQKGGFYSAQDADTEGVEGKYFVWTPEELAKILDEQDARYFAFYYDVSDAGNFEGENILNVKNSISETASAFEVSQDVMESSLESSRKKLFIAREKRVKPTRDEKVLTAWNGLMLAAFAEASAILDSDEYLEIARRNADFLLAELRADERVLRTWKDGTAKLNGYLEDYANLADGLFELFQVSGEEKYLVESRALADLLIDHFWDEDAGGFYFTSNDHEVLLIRSKDFYDNATPSGNSVATDILVKLAKVFGDEKYERHAERVLRLIADQIRRHPGAFGRVLSTLEFHLGDVKEIVILGEHGNKLEREVWKGFYPNKVVVASRSETGGDLTPLLGGKTRLDGKSTAFVCRNFTCQRPVTSAEELRLQLE